MGKKYLDTSFKVFVDSTSRFYLKDEDVPLSTLESSENSEMPTNRIFFEENNEPSLSVIQESSDIIYKKLIIETTDFFNPTELRINFQKISADSQSFRLSLIKNFNTPSIEEQILFTATTLDANESTYIISGSDVPPDFYDWDLYLIFGNL